MAAVSIFDIFKIGVGPSSSHTVGPMKAAAAFAHSLPEAGPVRLETTLYGSLAFTGRGHGTDSAIVIGLTGADPETLDPDAVPVMLAEIRESGELTLPSGRRIPFSAERDIVFNYEEELPRHTNGMRFKAFSPDGDIVAGGGVDGDVRLFDFLTKQPAGVLKSGGAQVTCLTFSADGKFLAASSDTSAHLWEVESRRLVGEISFPPPPEKILTQPLRLVRKRHWSGMHWKNCRTTIASRLFSFTGKTSPSLASRIILN